ncbi:hypothetical protein [Hallella absiana]|uniref:hypothetical protein n=1 Tax=Hallella absiana TaxID=2925336 RepID=UPI0021C9BEBA|nr:hypothetical protein [Hallella absiana]
MSIRLNKALRELNIGLQTAVEFLQKHPELGEVKTEPSFKLNDRQYTVLAEAFSNEKSQEGMYSNDTYNGTMGNDKQASDGFAVNFFFDNNDMIVLTMDNPPYQIKDVYGVSTAEGNTPNDAVRNLEKFVKQTIKDANAIIGLRLESKLIAINNTSDSDSSYSEAKNNCVNIIIAYGTAVRIETD